MISHKSSKTLRKQKRRPRAIIKMESSVLVKQEDENGKSTLYELVPGHKCDSPKAVSVNEAGTDSSIMHTQDIRNESLKTQFASINKSPEEITVEDLFKLGWSDPNKINAFIRKRHQRDNEYYMYFNEDDEKPKGGDWRKSECRRFLELYDPKTCRTKWGIFSRAIPGRNGRSCYRRKSFLSFASRGRTNAHA